MGNTQFSLSTWKWRSLALAYLIVCTDKFKGVAIKTALSCIKGVQCNVQCNKISWCKLLCWKNTYFICGQNIGWRIYQQGLVTLPKQIRGKGPRVHGTMSSGLIHMYLYCKVGIVHNYPTKGRWIHTVVVDIIYWDAKRRGIYLALFTDPRFMDWVFPWVLWSWFLSALISNFLAAQQPSMQTLSSML